MWRCCSKIYGRQTSAQYEKAIPLSVSFYAIEKNGKKGFLDIHTLQEYF